MTVDAVVVVPTDPAVWRERLLRAIVSSIFLLFIQTYMVAPLIPSLATGFNVSRQFVALLIPAYMLPYAVAALVCGVLADRFGRRGLLLFSFASFPLMSLLMAASPSLSVLIGLRVVSGATNVSIAVMGLALVGDLFPLNDRGRAVGWIFGAIAGGGAFGSTLGGVLEPVIGWRGLFLVVAVAGIVPLVQGVRLWTLLAPPTASTNAVSLSQSFGGFAAILRTPRGGRTYPYIFLNAVFHGGVFAWLGVLLHDRYGLGNVGIGLALLGYGVPGFFLGPTIGRLVDRYGRRRFIPSGFVIAALSAAALAPAWPLAVAAIAVTSLSFGFDMTHPLLAGIATTLDDRRRGQAMGLNTFSIFFGLGIGSLIFGWLSTHGMSMAMLVFAGLQMLLGVLAAWLFRNE